MKIYFRVAALNFEFVVFGVQIELFPWSWFIRCWCSKCGRHFAL